MRLRPLPTRRRGGAIRVLRVIDRLNVGGPALHAVLVSEGLPAERFDSLLVHGDIEPSEGDMGYLLEDHKVAVLRLPTLARAPRPLKDAQALLALYRLMRDQQPDVVHTHKSKAGLLGRVAALLAGVPVRVHTYHGHVLTGYFHPALAQALLLLERLLAHGTTRLLTISDRLRGELSGEQHIGAAGQFRVVPLGLALAPFRQADRLRGELRAELAVPLASPLLGMVGRMVPIKDHATFLRGAQRLRAFLPALRVVLVGAGEREAELRALAAELGLAEAVHFLGWRRDLPRICADLDVLALTSRNEGTPVAVIEAMAAGVPVVATAVGGVPDVLRGGSRGLLVPPGDVEALAQALQRALTDPALRARARDDSQRDAVCREYGIERLCQDLAALYEEELGKTEARRPNPVVATGATR